MTFSASILGFLLCSCSPAYIFSLPRNPTLQYEHAAKIEVTCSFLSNLRVHTGEDVQDAIVNSFIPNDEEHFLASGVFVSNRHVLTNAHVVTCSRGSKNEEIGRVTDIEVVLLDGTRHPASVDVLLPSRDIARVNLAVPLESDIRAPGIGTSPTIGDAICIATAVPRYSYKCATVEPSMAGFVELSTTQIEHGNSGSAASDQKGNLVGLVRALSQCEFGIPCMGQVTPITSSDAWLVR